MMSESQKQISVRRPEDIKQIHAGKRCFLIGNGPSLRTYDLELLQGEITFGCNNIYLSFDETSWRPTYYTVSDPMAARVFTDKIKHLNLNKIFSSSVKQYFDDCDDILWLEQIPYAKDDDLSDFSFSFDLASGVYHGATTLYIQFQIALYMGLKEVYLLGVDFDYAAQPTGERSGLGVFVEHEDEANHFHPAYRVPGEKWWLADRNFQYKTYEFARASFEAAGGIIYNASRKTALDVFPRIDFDALRLSV